MNPLEAPDDSTSTTATTTTATADVFDLPGQVLMSEFDKKSLRLIGLLVVSGCIILLILYCWAREFCRRNFGFGSKIFSARKKKKQKWKKLN